MAPMKDVTDPAWRALVAELGKPDVSFTQFVSADGLYHTNGLADKAEKSSARAARPIQHDFSAFPATPLMRDLRFSEAERPIVMQVFSSKPEMIAYAARLAAELGFDGLDINMGCPDKTIEHQGAGAALIKTPELAQALIRAAQVAVEIQNLAYRPNFVFPISVKTRIGYNALTLEEWLPALLAAKPAAITLHLRMRKEMSLVPAHWELMKRAVELRDRLAPEVLLIGNGDVQNLEEARARVAETGCDGVMIGRGMFGNPWVFADKERYRSDLSNTSSISLNANNLRLGKSGKSTEEKLAALLELARRFEALTPPKHFHILKKHIKAFVTGFDGASELRARLMETLNTVDLERIIKANPL